MCLTVPGKITKIEKEKVIVEYGPEISREANCSLIECKIGDYVIVQAGFVIEIVDEKKAKEMYDLLT